MPAPRKKKKPEELFIPPHMRRREPAKKKVKIPREMRRSRDQFGRWKKSATPGKSRDAVKAMTGNTGFLERVAALSDQDAVARKVVRLARRGDWAALQIQMQAVSLPVKSAGTADTSNRDWSRLSNEEIHYVMMLLDKAAGKISSATQVLPTARVVPDIESELDEIVERTAPVGEDEEADPPRRAAEVPPVNSQPAPDMDLLENQLAAEEQRAEQVRQQYGEETGSLTSGLRRRSGVFRTSGNYWRN
jgi:hypothetical protein